MAAAAPKMFTKQVLNSVTSCPFMRTGAIKTETLSMPQAVRNATAICPFLNEQSLSHPEKVFASIPLPTSLSSHPSLLSQPCEQCPVKEEVTLAKEVSSKTDKAIKVASPFVPKYDEVFSKEIQKVKSEGRYRIFADLERKVGSFPVAKCHNSQTGEVKPVVGWCSNDYLSMGQNEKVINAMVRAAKEVGTGAGGTRNISGTNHYHVLLEKELAALHKKPAALVFSSCYVANETTLTTMSKILGKESLCLSDELNHASMIQGIRNGIWEKKIYKHNDLNHLEDILKQQPLDRKKVLTYESVNSMEGSVAPMRELQFLADKYNCLSFVDEVHAVGMYGKTGAGVAERDNVEVDIISGTLGKAFGVMGGYVVGSEAYIDTMRSLCPGFIFTTAIPPPMAAALLASIQHLRSSSKERIAMHRNAHRLHSELRRIGLPMLPTISHITPVLVGDATKCKKVTDTLLNRYGIYVQPINYPTVPRGTERLRITPAPVHTEEMMNLLLKALDEIWTELELPRSYSDVIEGHEGLSDEEYGVGSASVYEHFMGEHAQDHYAFGMTSGGAVAAAA